jgi:hypothetical protein
MRERGTRDDGREGCLKILSAFERAETTDDDDAEQGRAEAALVARRIAERIEADLPLNTHGGLYAMPSLCGSA